jgi:deoxyribodipyrimidine photo-lyase
VNSILWFRRDLRISDHPALNAAADEAKKNGGVVVPVFILDKALIGGAGSKRLAYLGNSLRALDKSLGGNLHVMVGDYIEVLKELQKRYSATSVHISEEFERYGAERDKKVEAAGITLVRTGSPYAVAPGRVRKPVDSTPYKVYTPFYKAWVLHGWRQPAATPADITWAKPADPDRNFPDWKLPEGTTILEAGEEAAHKRFAYALEHVLDRYDETRNTASIDGTSRMSAHLKWGEIHPRTLLARLNQTKAHETFAKEIAWREFYADVLFHNPHTEYEYYAPRFAKMRYDEPGEKYQAWCEGKTGYPFVDAAMRQLLTEGWMHNRTRMVVASFLVKDLHIEWQHGEKFFREHLIDFDLASNIHGWQWTAGCGTDASPYYRVFNPIEQAKKFDPEGEYIRKYVPELAHLQAPDVFEPWTVLDGYLHDYPERIVDHALERMESLARLEEIKPQSE